MHAKRYAAAMSIDEFIERAQANQDFWRNARRLSRVDPAMQSRLAAIPGTWHLLALSEDWCTDAMSTLPVLARLVEGTAQVDLRLLSRDANPDLMDSHLSAGKRSIPVVMVLDAEFVEHGWWGPRPSALQAWFLGEAQALERPARGRQKREWYARDRGASTAAEVVALLEQVAAGTVRGG